MVSSLIIRVFLVTLILAVAQCGQSSANSLAKIKVGDKEVTAELAITADERGRGLQNRIFLPEDRGMLFVFPTEGNHVFWMKDTYIPLSVAFIKESGVIVQIEEMEPGSLKHYASEETVKYALEMNGGWFKRNNVRVGDRVTIPLAANKGK